MIKKSVPRYWQDTWLERIGCLPHNFLSLKDEGIKKGKFGSRHGHYKLCTKISTQLRDSKWPRNIKRLMSGHIRYKNVSFVLSSKILSRVNFTILLRPSTNFSRLCINIRCQKRFLLSPLINVKIMSVDDIWIHPIGDLLDRVMRPLTLE